MSPRWQLCDVSFLQRRGVVPQHATRNLTWAVGSAVGHDGTGIIATASLLSAVAETVAKVWVGAEAGSITGRAAKLRGHAEHVVDAGGLETLSVWGVSLVMTARLRSVCGQRLELLLWSLHVRASSQLHASEVR